VVIDNASTDSTKETVRRLQLLVPITYDCFEKIGVNRARNRAIEICKGDILAFIDDDAVAVPTWVDAMKRKFERFPQATAVVGCKENLHAGALVPSVIQFTERDLAMARDHDGELVKSPTLVDTCNFAFRKQRILESNIRFDEHLKKGGDRHFGHQLFNAGKTVLFAEDSIVLHSWPSTYASYFRMRWNAGVARRLLSKRLGEQHYRLQTRSWSALRMLGFTFKKGAALGPVRQPLFVVLVLAGHAVYLLSQAVNQNRA
jgi:glycosyltransferase involved in cell wall biosynthesis